MTVRAILDSKGHHILNVGPEEKLSAAIKLLGERKIGAVLVMSKGHIDGILSERDIVRVLSERGAGVLDEPVSEVMTRKVVGCRQSDTVAAIMEMIVKWRVREYENEQEALRQYIKTA
jgi:CBS domain-containing protein